MCYLFKADIRTLMRLVAQLVRANDLKSSGRRFDPGPSHIHMLYSQSMKIGIAGPGRSGTSLLTLLFSKFGFHTAVEDGVFHE